MRAVTLVFTVFLLAILGYETACATICKPLSRFKVDCNTCFCGRDGSRYACTRKVCAGEPADFQFLNDEGYDDFTLPKGKDSRIPYINDEIPPSKEQWDDIQLDDLVQPEDYILPGAAYDPRFIQPQNQEVELDDQDAEEFGGAPEDYRFKREILI